MNDGGALSCIGAFTVVICMLFGFYKCDQWLTHRADQSNQIYEECQKICSPHPATYASSPAHCVCNTAIEYKPAK